MSETPSETSPDPTDEKPFKLRKGTEYSTENKRKLGFKQKMAMLEIIERKRLSDRVDYKAIARRTGVSEGSCRQLWVYWKKGWIDLGDPVTPEERQIDARMQHEKTLELIKRYKALVLSGFESNLIAAEDATTNGEIEAWKKVSPIIKELKAVSEIQAMHERGYNSILEEIAANRSREQKQITGSTTPETLTTTIIRANDEDTAMQALNGHRV